MNLVERAEDKLLHHICPEYLPPESIHG